MILIVVEQQYVKIIATLMELLHVPSTAFPVSFNPQKPVGQGYYHWP